MKNESVDAKWNMFQQRLIGIMDSCMPHKFIIPHAKRQDFSAVTGGGWQIVKKIKIKSGNQKKNNK